MKFLLVSENALHWLVWNCMFFYSFVQFCIKSIEYRHYYDDSDYKSGWSMFAGQEQDKMDEEWQQMTVAASRYWPWIIGHISIGIIIRNSNKSVLWLYSSWISISVSILLFAFGLKITSFYLLLIAVSLFACKTKSKLLIITICVITIYWIIYFKSGLNRTENFLFKVSYVWVSARCVSFASDILIDDKSIDKSVILSCYAFVLYFPTLFTGPLSYYSDFVKETSNLNQISNVNLYSKIPKTVLEFMRYFLIVVLFEIFLHFCYSSSMQMYPTLLEDLNGFELCGLGVALPLLFFMKYKIIYGLAGYVSGFDGVIVSPPPKCIARGHLSTFLWKHFDRGLHCWLLKYIYLPLVGAERSFYRKIFACGICFLFVCLWHGFYPNIKLWCIINFIGVIIETIGFDFHLKLFNYINFKPSEANYKRIRALAAAPCMMLMCVSNVFFLSNWETGMIILDQVVMTFPLPLIPCFLTFYCGCHVCIDIAKFEKCYFSPEKKT